MLLWEITINVTGLLPSLVNFHYDNCVLHEKWQESDGDGGAGEKKERKTEAEVVG